jgi:hypothetical protein
LSILLLRILTPILLIGYMRILAKIKH